jgi:hypothetical protein
MTPWLAPGPVRAGEGASSQEVARRFTGEWAELLETTVARGLVDYGDLARRAPRLESIEALVARIDPEDLPRDERVAFWINAYNFLVVSTVARAYPVGSPRDIPGFFDARKHTVGGQPRTLDEIEGQLRRETEDARIHFALVCAAMSCPPLPREPYFGETLERTLEERARATIRDPAFCRVDAHARKVLLSEIFEWYRADFERGGESLRDYLSRYAERELPREPTFEFVEYDWTLNVLARTEDDVLRTPAPAQGSSSDD